MGRNKVVKRGEGDLLGSVRLNSRRRKGTRKIKKEAGIASLSSQKSKGKGERVREGKGTRLKSAFSGKAGRKGKGGSR